jgi:hypothetical protein
VGDTQAVDSVDIQAAVADLEVDMEAQDMNNTGKNDSSISKIIFQFCK